MSNPISKLWKYITAWFDAKIEENADPKIQIEQAINDAKIRHSQLSAQAAAVIGNQRQIEMELNRKLANIEKLHSNTKRALEMADSARAKGNTQEATQYENAAESFASKLVTEENSVEDLKKLYDQAFASSQSAKNAVERNALKLQEQISERTKLLSQLEQAKMQEKVSESLSSMNQLSSIEGPNLDSVREKIENRYAKALGRTELEQNSVQNRMAEIEAATVVSQQKSRLEAIRKELGSSQ